MIMPLPNRCLGRALCLGMVLACGLSPGVNAGEALESGMAAATSIALPAKAGSGVGREARVLFDGPGLRLATVILRSGTRFDEHSAPAPVTIQALSGSGTVVVGEKRYRVDPTALVLLDANVVHAVEPDPGSDLVLLVHHLGNPRRDAD